MFDPKMFAMNVLRQNPSISQNPRNQDLLHLSNELRGKFLTKVLLHELGHCTIFSFNLLDDIHRMVLPKYWFEAEEWVCNFIADYGESIFGVAYSILGEDAWALIPYELEKMIA